MPRNARLTPWGRQELARRIVAGLAPSTVHRVLRRHGVNRLSWMDRPTGEPIRRYEHDRPGDLVHVDSKELGRIHPGGGWRAHGRDSAQNRAARSAPRVGYGDIHTAIDDHSRVAYSEILDHEKTQTAVAFWQRAHAGSPRTASSSGRR